MPFIILTLSTLHGIDIKYNTLLEIITNCHTSASGHRVDRQPKCSKFDYEEKTLEGIGHTMELMYEMEENNVKTLREEMDLETEHETRPRIFQAETTVLPAKSDSDVMFCLQSNQGLRIDRSLALAQVKCTR